MKKSVLNSIKLFRKDMGNLLFHFTKSRPQGTLSPLINPYINVPLPPGADNAKSAFYVLSEILVSSKLIGTSKCKRGGHRCVSFTEWPVSELASLFAINNELIKEGDKPRYEPYGIAVNKDWLFDKGGRPVIYQSEKEYKELPVHLQWRHVRYEPRYYDFTWEREWRISCPELPLNPLEVLVIVRNRNEAYDVTYGFSQISNVQDPNTGAKVKWSKPSWMAVSLDLFN